MKKSLSKYKKIKILDGLRGGLTPEEIINTFANKKSVTEWDIKQVKDNSKALTIYEKDGKVYKVCQICKVPKEYTTENFYRNCNYKNGISSVCKYCGKIKSNNYNIINAEKVKKCRLKANHKHYNINKKQINKERNERRKNDPEFRKKINLQQKKYVFKKKILKFYELIMKYKIRNDIELKRCIEALSFFENPKFFRGEISIAKASGLRKLIKDYKDGV